MSPESANNELITSVPGAEPFADQLPERGIVSVEPTAEVRANAMYSPENTSPGAFKGETVGDTAVSAEVTVDEASVEPVQNKDSFADVWSTEEIDEKAAIEAAAVRPAAKPINGIAVRTQQQMDINRADRENRENAGLPPRTFDLR